MLNRFVILILASLLMLSCSSTENKPGFLRRATEGHAFNPQQVTEEEKIAVIEDLNQFVGNLNWIVQRRDYSAWTKSLTPRYQEYLASAENLKLASQADRLKTRNVVLKSLYDYFINVVVPSRTNGRVDDMEYLSENRVKAYMIVNGQRLRLYELERDGDTWKISN
jgi:hypothetical protein